MSEINLTLIKTSNKLQTRAETVNMLVVDDYSDEMKNGTSFPPIEVVFDGTDYWLWDGYHRVEAAKQAGLTSIEANITNGTLGHAEWLAVTANKTNGLHRSNADKRRTVELALLHPNSASLTNNQIAQHCGVSHTFVNNMRSILKPFQDEERTVHRNGKTYSMKVTNIGKSSLESATVHLEKVTNEAREAIEPLKEPETLEQCKSHIEIASHWQNEIAEARIRADREAAKVLENAPHEKKIAINGTEYIHLFPNLVPDLEGQEYISFRDSIARFGIVIPVSVDEYWNVIDGWQRLRVAKELGLKDIYVRVHIGLTMIEKLELWKSFNLIRGHYTPSQRACIAVEVPNLAGNGANR